MDETSAGFTIGAPQPVTDPGALPAVSADEEAAFLGGLVGGDDQPDGGPDEQDDATAQPEQTDDEPVADPAELDTVVAGVSTDAADETGFDDADVVALEVSLDPGLEAALGFGAPVDVAAGGA